MHAAASNLPRFLIRRLGIFLVLLAIVFPYTSAADSLIYRSTAEGGKAMASLFDGGYAYVGFANVLVVKNVSNPASPFEVADRLLGGEVRDIERAGNYLYLAVSESGVAVFDVADPTDPTNVATFDTPGKAVSIALSGNYAFIADETGGLRVLDISNPGAPVEIGSETTSADVTDVAVQGNYAYLSGEVALLILDVSIPSTPVMTGSYDLSGNSMAVAVQGDHAYHVHDIHLRSFDITDKSNPVPLDAGLVDGGNNVVLNATHAFVPSQSGVRIFDITDPTQVTHVGTANGRHGFDVSLSGNLAYVAGGLGGFDVRDVTDVTNPQMVYDGSKGWNEGVAVALAGDLAFVAAQEDLLKVVDVSDADDIVEVGNMEFIPFHLPLKVTAVAATGSYAYVAQGQFGLAGVDVEIIDVTNPSNPVHAGTYNDQNNIVEIISMQIVGNFLYTARGSFGLRIYDITLPLTPLPIANFNTIGRANDIAVDGNVVYVLDGGSPQGLKVVDTSNPPTLLQIGNFTTPGEAKALALDAVNDRLYIAIDGNGLLVLNVSVPSTPVKDGDLLTIPGASDVSISGNYAYLADAAAIHIVDVSDPTAPQEVGLFDETSGGELRVMTRGNDVLVLEQFAGLYSLRNDATPTGAGDPTRAPHSALAQNVPNPFNPQTVIRYTISTRGHVQLKVYNASGHLVRVLVDGVRASRTTPYDAVWDGRDDAGTTVASGVYFYQLAAPGIVQTKKMVLLK
jgi:hypothetical protein